MIKQIITTWFLASVTLVIAGGNISPNISAVANIPANSCNKDAVYMEDDAKLMWQDQAYVDAEDGAYKQERSVGKSGRWSHAKNYCARLNYAGYADWRLPTSDELQYIHRKEGQLFVNFRGQDFWTSTPASRGKYYVVYPADGYRYERKAKRSNFIRCVRCYESEEKGNGSRILRTR